jgi:YfiH family protein
MKFYPSKLLSQSPKLLSTFTNKSSHNLAFHVEDKYEDVLYNHQQLAHSLGYDYTKLVHMQQIHSNKVKILTKEDNFFHPPRCDAIITDQKEIPIMVMVADCSPILFYDKKHEIIAVAHAGRAGAFSNIVQNVLDCFREHFQSCSSDIRVSIGPAICQDCYELSPEIYLQAKQCHLEYPFKQQGKRYYLDIRAILKQQLLDGGIEQEHIEIATLCPSCHTQEYYSYRAEGKTGRFAGILMLK